MWSPPLLEFDFCPQKAVDLWRPVKTHVVLLLSINIKPPQTINLYCDNSPINIKQTYKYLGLTFTNDGKLKNHIQNIYKSV